MQRMCVRPSYKTLGLTQIKQANTVGNLTKQQQETETYLTVTYSTRKVEADEAIANRRSRHAGRCFEGQNEQLAVFETGEDKRFVGTQRDRPNDRRHVETSDYFEADEHGAHNDLRCLAGDEVVAV